MRIAIDIRSLIEPFPSGVTEYARQIVKKLLIIDRENEYLLFCNSAKGLPIQYYKRLKQPNVRLIVRRVPNKLFNTLLFLFEYPKLDHLLKDVDIFFLPNFNFTAISRGKKLVVTVHDVSFKYPSFYSPKRYFWHYFIKPKQLLDKAVKVIAVSESTKNDLQRVYGVPSEKIKVIHLGVDREYFQNIKKEKLEKLKQKYHLAAPFILYLGNVERRKNITGLLAAWQMFKNRQPSDYQLVVVGQSIDRRQFPELPGVKFLGYVSEGEKSHLYHLAKAFVYPSYYEGFGLPVLEAMAAGLPVITSFSTAIPEVGRQSVLLVDPYNIKEIAEAIYQITTNEKLRQYYIKKATITSEQFCWEKTARQTLELFNSI